MFDAIDWQRPWLKPLLPVAEPILAAADWREALNCAAQARRLCNHRGLPIRYVPQDELPAGTAYEAFISASGRVPTRDNLHDFFNALVWLSFPRIKCRLNELQAGEIARETLFSPPKAERRRSKLRDAATIFDENAAVLFVERADLVSALRARRWGDVFLEMREAYEKCWSIRLFGHALMEKLITPYKAVTAHAWPVIVEAGFFSLSLSEQDAYADRVVSQRLTGELVNRDFVPLPVLGVPGWWRDQNAAFYNDTTVFRPPRQLSCR